MAKDTVPSTSAGSAKVWFCWFIRRTENQLSMSEDQEYFPLQTRNRQCFLQLLVSSPPGLMQTGLKYLAEARPGSDVLLQESREEVGETRCRRMEWKKRE